MGVSERAAFRAPKLPFLFIKRFRLLAKPLRKCVMFSAPEKPGAVLRLLKPGTCRE
jgi:hypothetical protein